MTTRLAGRHTDRKKTGRQTNRQGDNIHSSVTKSMTGLSDPRVEGHDDRQKDRQAHRQTNKQAHTQTNKQAHTQTNKQADRQTGKETLLTLQ